MSKYSDFHPFNYLHWVGSKFRSKQLLNWSRKSLHFMALSLLPHFKETLLGSCPESDETIPHIIIIIIIYLSWSWAICWPVPVSRIRKSLLYHTIPNYDLFFQDSLEHCLTNIQVSQVASFLLASPPNSTSVSSMQCVEPTSTSHISSPQYLMQIMDLLLLSPSFCNLIRLGSKFSPQHPLLHILILWYVLDAKHQVSYPRAVNSSSRNNGSNNNNNQYRKYKPIEKSQQLRKP